MSERNIFLVSTALQLLNAIEAQHFFNTRNNTLVLLFYGNQNKDHDQLLSQVELFEHSRLIIFDVAGDKTYLKKMLELMRELKLETYDRVFSGFFSANLRRFIANIQYKELYLLDDGVYTIAVHNELYNPSAEGYHRYILDYSEKKGTSKRKRIIFVAYHYYRKLFLRVNGFRNEMKKIDTSFFTVFDLPQFADEVVINHNLSYVRNLFQLPEGGSYTDNLQGTVFFLGQPLERSVDLDSTKYLVHLKEIFNYYKSEHLKVIYVPHRAEDQQLIASIKEFYAKHINVLLLTQPFELYLLKNNIQLSRIGSFASTALFTVKKLYPEAEVDAFRFPVQGKIGKTTELVFDRLIKDGATVFNWDEHLKTYSI